MTIKNSAMVGKAVSRLMETEALDGNQFAQDINVSRQHGNHMKNNRRKMPQDLAASSMATYDNPEFTTEILFEFSDGYTSPVFRGACIERHRLAIEECAIREMEEAILTMRRISLVKPPNQLNKQELDDIQVIIDEILDARSFLDNLLIQLQDDYKVSIKKRIKQLLPRWRARGWLV